MSEILSDDEVRIGMRRQGIPDHAIERTLAERKLKAVTLGYCTPRQLEPVRSPDVAKNAILQHRITWPVQLTLPWSTLVSDNLKLRAQLRGQQAIMVITSGYAEAEERIRELAKSKLAGAEPAAEPLALLARVWMPDNRVHDLTNSCKLVHDALEGAVYENDRWLYDVHWIRAGVDVDAPRAEINITRLGGPE